MVKEDRVKIWQRELPKKHVTITLSESRVSNQNDTQSEIGFDLLKEDKRFVKQDGSDYYNKSNSVINLKAEPVSDEIKQQALKRMQELAEKGKIKLQARKDVSKEEVEFNKDPNQFTFKPIVNKEASHSRRNSISSARQDAAV